MPAHIPITGQNGDVIHAFPSGTLSLDFVGTRRKRSSDAPVEKLRAPSDVDAWLTESGIVDDAEPGDDTDLTAGIELREAIYALMRARMAGDTLPAEAVARVNAAAAEPPLGIRITDTGPRRYGTPRQAYSTLAREAIGIASGDDGALLRECGRPECTQLYLDRSRGHRREWCSMATCGNRMKAAAYRARQRG